jgi:hypothetical protein
MKEAPARTQVLAGPTTIFPTQRVHLEGVDVE